MILSEIIFLPFLGYPVCMISYSEGFYDPCFDWDCNFYCPSSAGKRVEVADPDNCNTYFICDDNQLIPQTCKPGMLYNYIRHGCVYQRDGMDKCQPPCLPRGLNVYRKFIRYPNATANNI